MSVSEQWKSHPTILTYSKPPAQPVAMDLINAHLPVEILCQVFQILDLKTRARCLTVCKRWAKTLYTTPNLWQVLDLSNRQTLGGDKNVYVDPEDPKEINWVLVNLLQSRPRCLFTGDPKGAGDEGMKEVVGRVGWMTEMMMMRSAWGFEASPRFQRVTRLDLSCSAFDLATFSIPAVRDILGPTLTHLILSGCASVDSGSLYHLKSLPALEYLNVSHCENLDDMGLEAISFFANSLVSLNLSYLFKISEFGVRFLFRMPKLTSVNLMGCCRIKSYAWATSEQTDRIATLPIKELSTGEDSRIQTKGFWLLWCTFQTWDFGKLIKVCPFLETLRLNMVLFDLATDSLKVLLEGAKNLKNLSLVADRNLISALCSVAPLLQKLTSLDLTMHIGVNGEHLSSLIKAKALTKLKGLKFHSKHSNVFTDESLKGLVEIAPALEYLELNGEELKPQTLKILATSPQSKTLQSILLHHIQLTNDTMQQFSKNLVSLREITITDIQQLGGKNKLSMLVSHTPGLSEKLKKIELASYKGFKDADLALIPVQCPNLHTSATSTAKKLKNPSSTKPKEPTPRSPYDFLCSSPECRSLLHFSSKYGRKLRVLDLAGPVGVTNHVLKSFAGLPMLHTLFLENMEGISPLAVVKFAEDRYKTLKRLHLRGCRGGGQLGVVYENYVTKGLEVDLIVDGIVNKGVDMHHFGIDNAGSKKTPMNSKYSGSALSVHQLPRKPPTLSRFFANTMSDDSSPNSTFTDEEEDLDLLLQKATANLEARQRGETVKEEREKEEQDDDQGEKEVEDASVKASLKKKERKGLLSQIKLTNPLPSSPYFKSTSSNKSIKKLNTSTTVKITSSTQKEGLDIQVSKGLKRKAGEAALLEEVVVKKRGEVLAPELDHDPKTKKKLAQSQETLGPKWFDLPAPELTDSLKHDLLILKSRGVLDPKRFYKKPDQPDSVFPKFFQVGTIVNHSADFYSGRLTKKERKSGFVEELLADKGTKGYVKKKFLEIQEAKGANEKKKKGKKKAGKGGRGRK
ncbi:hypothetical protein HDV05_000304 [Chytridiales sp. JEL 0842]|nr:hypothetical protein HDV05_000304 [Chytridiales sp. JEL 0842]